MAQFTRVNGDFKPVLHLDAAAYTNTGVNAVTSAATVQPQGPKLEFATITFTGTGTTGAQILAAINTIQQLATIYMYEFTTAADDTLAVAMYPIGAWGDVTATAAGSLDAELTAACGEAVAVTATATFTN
jgi:adenosine deaminase